VKQGRPAVTTREELELVALQLFAERGFDSTTVDDVAEAAGIGRRTFFRYFASKNDVVWGDWDVALAYFRGRLAALPAEVDLMDGLREAVKAFNLLPDGAEAQHRVRMAMVLHTPAWPSTSRRASAAPPRTSAASCSRTRCWPAAWRRTSSGSVMPQRTFRTFWTKRCPP
jgi:AcrR family transcriptional regulator